jgi:hypothetical protein
MGKTTARGIFQVGFHIAGTTAANANIRWTAPCDCTLIHVSAVGSNDGDATLIVGDSTDTNGYLTAFAIGDSNTPVEKEAVSDFSGDLAGSQYPRISDGDVLVLTLDYDGDGGTAADDVTIVLTFAEG